MYAIVEIDKLVPKKLYNLFIKNPKIHIDDKRNWVNEYCSSDDDINVWNDTMYDLDDYYVIIIK